MSADAGDPLVLTIQQMATLLLLSPRTIKRRVDEGTFPLPPLPLPGSQLRWHRATVMAWLQKPSTLRGVPGRRFA